MTPKKTSKKQASKQPPAKKPRGKAAKSGKGRPGTPPPAVLTLDVLAEKCVRADLRFKIARAKKAEIEVLKIKGEMIKRSAAAEQALLMIEEIQREVLEAIAGISKIKYSNAVEIFRKYLS